jgi:Cu/Zn superoxide dismutase
MPGMKNKFALAVLVLTLAAMSATAQTTTTNTNCSVFGNQVNCTSTSTDDSAARAAQAEQQRESYETGQAMGAAIGRSMQMHRFHHWQKKYCKQHPGASWWYQFDMSNPNTRVTGTCD